MKLWILRPINSNSGPWDRWYDKAFGFIVAAPSEQEARDFVADSPLYGDEGKECWLDASLSSCTELSHEGKSRILMRDFRAA